MTPIKHPSVPLWRETGAVGFDRREVATCVVLFIASVLIFWWARLPVAVDDAWITYRYAHNLASGNGFVYNVGERVLGTSTPLWTLLLALLSRFGADIPTASVVMGASFAAATIVFVYLVGKQLGLWTPVAILAALLTATDAVFASWAASGMEAPFYAFLGVAAVWTFGENRLFWAAILAALAVVLRLDGLTVGTALVIVYLVSKQRIPPSPVMAVFAMMLLPWFVFSHVYFDSVLPNSMQAKQGYEGFAPWITRYFLWPFSPEEPAFAAHALGRIMQAPLLVAGLALAAVGLSRGRLAVGAVGAWVIVYLVAYEVARMPVFPWYLVPMIPMVALLAMLGAQWLGLRLLGLLLGTGRARTALSLAGAVLLMLSAWAARPFIDNMKEYSRNIEGGRLVIGKWLAQNSSSQAIIMTGAIGIIGYVVPNYIHDAAGLVTRRDASHPVYDVPFYKPNYFVHMDEPGLPAEAGLASDAGNYELVFQVPVNDRQFQKVFRRKDIADTTK